MIPIPTLPNLRDLGGWPAGVGRRVRAGLMFRSTDLGRLDGPGIEALGNLSLRTVIDLRTVAERQASPDQVPPGATLVLCDVLGDAPDAAPAQLPKVMADPRSAAAILGDGKAEEMFERGYRDIVGLPSALVAYRRFFATLASADSRPMLFHCTTGKDRTGWAAAVTLTLLGVSKEDVMRDYILTNSQLLPALRSVADRFAVAGGDPELLQPVLGVRPAYLEAAFGEVRQRYGSMDRYLCEGLEINDSLRQRLRDELTEKTIND